MKRISGAIHVATTRRKYKGKVYEAHLLRRSYREEGKVKHETLGNLSHLPLSVIDLVRRALKGETLLAAQDQFECLRSLPHGHVAATLGMLRKVGLHHLLGAKATRLRKLVVAMIVSRVVDPQSKLATSRCLKEETATSTLGELLGLGDVTEDEFYKAMDWLLARQAKIEKELAKRHLNNTLVLYDITSSYFEGKTCSLAKLGHNRDGKKGKLQIVIGLLCNREGCPVSIEVFAGNTGDPTTLRPQVEKIRDRFGLSRVVLVGDRGMITNTRIKKDLDAEAGFSWVTALRSSGIRRLLDQKLIQPSLFDETDLVEIESDEYPGQRLVVCYNPLLQANRARKRQELLEATECRLQKIVEATQREKRPLRGADAIGLRVGKVLNKFKVGKHFRLQITDSNFSFTRREDQISKEAELDGLYVVRTDIPKDEISAEETVRIYKGLSVVERAFRSMKTVDLKIRPIHHRLSSRVKAHVFICMLSYYVEWHMRKALAPLLFDDENPEEGEEGRASIVSPAQRSPGAKEKAAKKKTKEGMPVHSFRTLLQDLGTIVSSRMRPKGVNGETFTLLTTPTPIQRRAFDLLEVPVNM